MKIEKKFALKNKLGLHARPAAMFVQIANKYKSEIFVVKGNNKINGKSIMGILTLAAENGSNLNVIIDGDDADEMMKSIAILFETNFEEE